MTMIKTMLMLGSVLVLEMSTLISWRWEIGNLQLVFRLVPFEHKLFMEL